jgi:hypothetical protein
MKFTLEINLGDPEECKAFVASHGTMTGRALANRLGFRGRGAARAATALSCYAWNSFTAINLRTAGNIDRALHYEAICDRIYKNDIKTIIRCW